MAELVPLCPRAAWHSKLAENLGSQGFLPCSEVQPIPKCRLGRLGRNYPSPPDLTQKRLGLFALQSGLNRKLPANLGPMASAKQLEPARDQDFLFVTNPQSRAMPAIFAGIQILAMVVRLSIATQIARPQAVDPRAGPQWHQLEVQQALTVDLATLSSPCLAIDFASTSPLDHKSDCGPGPRSHWTLAPRPWGKSRNLRSSQARRYSDLAVNQRLIPRWKDWH